MEIDLIIVEQAIEKSTDKAILLGHLVSLSNGVGVDDEQVENFSYNHNEDRELMCICISPTTDSKGGI
jgi:hypothetical protein